MNMLAAFLSNVVAAPGCQACLSSAAIRVNGTVQKNASFQPVTFFKQQMNCHDDRGENKKSINVCVLGGGGGIYDYGCMISPWVIYVVQGFAVYTFLSIPPPPPPHVLCFCKRLELI